MQLTALMTTDFRFTLFLPVWTFVRMNKKECQCNEFSALFFFRLFDLCDWVSHACFECLSPWGPLALAHLHEGVTIKMQILSLVSSMMLVNSS